MIEYLIAGVVSALLGAGYLKLNWRDDHKWHLPHLLFLISAICLYVSFARIDSGRHLYRYIGGLVLVAVLTLAVSVSAQQIETALTRRRQRRK